MNRRQFLQGASSAVVVALTARISFNPEPKMMALERHAVARHEWWISYLEKWHSKDESRIQAAKANANERIADFESYWGQKLGRRVVY